MQTSILLINLRVISHQLGVQKGTRTRTGRDFYDFQTVSNGLDHEEKTVHFGDTRFSNGFKSHSNWYLPVDWQFETV